MKLDYEISADELELIENHLRQNLSPDEVILFEQKMSSDVNWQHKIEEATAYGYKELAHFWTIPKSEDPELHAHAKIIRFYPQSSNITLEQKVHIEQGKNTFQGDLIHYNNADQTISVPPSSNGKAILVYNPERQAL